MTFSSISKITVKDTYINMIEDAYIPSSAESHWQNKLNTQTLFNWKEIWHKACSKILDHDDKDLLYRLINRILPTKDVLYKMKKVHETKCGLCKISKETLEHLFIYCCKTLPSWLFIENIYEWPNSCLHWLMNPKLVGWREEVFRTI